VKVVLDECLPRRLKQGLIGHDVKTVPEMGWAGIKNEGFAGPADQESSGDTGTLDGVPPLDHREVRSSAMFLRSGLTTEQLGAAFAAEIEDAGGRVLDTYDDGERLYARSTLPWVHEVRKADTLQGGVALRAVDEEIKVHPYLFRLVCTNGAIMAHAIETQILQGLTLLTPEEVVERLRAAVRACAAREAFTVSIEEVRRSMDGQADMTIALMPTLSRLGAAGRDPVLRNVMSRFFSEGDRSRFGLMNAVTSVARDTPDPELRWELEELGGSIPAAVSPSPLRRAGAALDWPLAPEDLSVCGALAGRRG
jgi:hypothetical protein